MAHVRIFLSTVSAEFRSYRDALCRDLDRPNVTVKVQEDFIATGTETLDKLDEYIRQCDAVIHLVGDMTGAWAKALYGEAEPLMRRALEIFIRSLGAEHSNLRTVMGNYIGLMHAMGRSEDEIQKGLAEMRALGQ